MQKAVCEMDAIPKLAQIISVMEDGDLMYGIVDHRDKLKEVKYGVHTAILVPQSNLLLEYSPSHTPEPARILCWPWQLSVK